jgi:hypothetical protein
MTLWEDAHNHDASVCGKYFSYWDLYNMMTDTNHLHVEFPVQIGLDDMLIFQAFDLFPNCVLGNLELVIQCSADALVWCCCDPLITLPEYLQRGCMNPTDNGDANLVAWIASNSNPNNGESRHTMLQVGAQHLVPFDTDCYYDRRFIQAFQEGRCATNLLPVKGDRGRYSYYFRDIHLYPVDILITEANSTLSGFKLPPQEIQLLSYHYAQTPMVVPAEIVRSYSFTTAPTDGGLNCVINVAMIFVKEICVLFPRLATDLTCFLNPMLANFSLQVD